MDTITKCYLDSGSVTESTYVETQMVLKIYTNTFRFTELVVVFISRMQVMGVNVHVTTPKQHQLTEGHHLVPYIILHKNAMTKCSVLYTMHCNKWYHLPVLVLQWCLVVAAILNGELKKGLPHHHNTSAKTL